MTYLKVTESGKSYRNSNGAYQKEFDKLWKDLVPESGQSSGRLTHDFANNGNCNVVESIKETCGYCYGVGTEVEIATCSDCDGSGEIGSLNCYSCDGSGEIEEEVECQECYGTGEIEEEQVIVDFYQGMINYLKVFLKEIPEGPKSVKKLEEFIETTPYETIKFTNNQFSLYNLVTDLVVFKILNKI